MQKQRTTRPTLSPVLVVLITGLGVLTVLLARGLNIGPLHTDVIVHRAWFDEVGARGFSEKYFDFNQRHPLVGPINAAAYVLFAEHDLPYHVIFQMSRVLEGVFLAGIVCQLTNRRLLALCAGWALMLTPIRLPELYQGINWYIEPTLALLLASSYTYLLALRQPSPTYRTRFYWLSVLLYSVSVLTYESGLPWIGVNMLLGWLVRDTESGQTRIRLVIRDALPIVIVGVIVAILMLFVFDPWTGLAPDENTITASRALEHVGTVLTLPALLIDRLRVTSEDGYTARTLAAALVAGGILLGWGWRRPRAEADAASRRDYLVLLVLGEVMVIASVLLGTVTHETGHQLLDRLTFGRAAGTMLLVVTALFALADWLIKRPWHGTIAAGLAGLLLIGPGFAWLLTYQDYAQQSRREINRIADAITEVRQTIYTPLHLVVLTERDWPAARFVDASDVIVHEIQQVLWANLGGTTLDILKVGEFEEVYATHPGTCDTLTGQASAGICITDEGLHTSRWAASGPVPLEDVVIVRYDHHTGQMTVIPALELATLDGYNVASAGPDTIQTNPARLAVPLGE